VWAEIRVLDEALVGWTWWISSKVRKWCTFGNWNWWQWGKRTLVCDLLFVRHFVGVCVFLFLASYLSWRYYGGFYLDNVRLFLVFSYSCCLETLVVCVCVVSLCFWWDVSYGAMVTFDIKGGDSEKMEERNIAKFFF